MDKNQEVEKAISRLRPDVERLVRTVEENPAAMVTGIVFGMKPKFFVRFGNIENRGDELIHLYLVLATLAAEMEEKNPYHDVHYVEMDTGVKPVGQSPEEIADALARECLIYGESPQVLDLAKQYIMSRRPPAAILLPASSEEKPDGK
jgi:hypothetical protein